jgi:hypothetical protein
LRQKEIIQRRLKICHWKSNKEWRIKNAVTPQKKIKKRLKKYFKEEGIES